MTSEALRQHVSIALDREHLAQGALAHGPSGMHFLRFLKPTGQSASVYRPLLCLVLQGAKEVATSARTLLVASGQSLIVSHALPVVSRITKADPEHPYVALVFPINLDLMRGLMADLTPRPAAARKDPFSISLCDTDQEMADALLRYLKQCGTEDARSLLAPITAREIHARLLMGAHGEQLQRLLWLESTSSRISQATRQIHADLTRTITVADLAHRVGMSSSAFFEHFKAVTGTSPLQYQKDLRLLRAREALLSTSEKVSEIAFGVGYESPAQFSREYARKFGCPPRQDRMLSATE